MLIDLDPIDQMLIRQAILDTTKGNKYLKDAYEPTLKKIPNVLESPAAHTTPGTRADNPLVPAGPSLMRQAIASNRSKGSAAPD